MMIRYFSRDARKLRDNRQFVDAVMKINGVPPQRRKVVLSRIKTDGDVGGWAVEHDAQVRTAGEGVTTTAAIRDGLAYPRLDAFGNKIR